MKILCFGDSNTYGYDPRSYFGGQYSSRYRWVDLLADLLGCEAINEGENGREIPHKERDFLLFARMLAGCKPVDLLIIMLGTNDLLQGNPAEEIVLRMQHFLEHIDLDKSKILLIGPPVLQRGEWVPSQHLVNASSTLNRKYEVLAGQLNAAYADAGTWNIPLTFDGVHFTEEGHQAFAEHLADYLKNGGYHDSLCFR